MLPNPPSDNWCEISDFSHTSINKSDRTLWFWALLSIVGPNPALKLPSLFEDIPGELVLWVTSIEIAASGFWFKSIPNSCALKKKLLLQRI